MSVCDCLPLFFISLVLLSLILYFLGPPHSQNTEESTRKLLEVSDRIKLLEEEVTRYREESGKSQAEVERLMGILREQETERTNKEKKITELER